MSAPCADCGRDPEHHDTGHDYRPELLGERLDEIIDLLRDIKKLLRVE